MFARTVRAVPLVTFFMILAAGTVSAGQISASADCGCALAPQGLAPTAACEQGCTAAPQACDSCCSCRKGCDLFAGLKGLFAGHGCGKTECSGGCESCGQVCARSPRPVILAAVAARAAIYLRA